MTIAKSRHQDVFVRTTLTIDPDVGKLLEQEVERSRKPLKQVVNEALRRGLTRARPPASKLVLKVHDSRLCPGYDPRTFNALADELEDQATLYSNDTDFERFQGLRWLNPLAPPARRAR